MQTADGGCYFEGESTRQCCPIEQGNNKHNTYWSCCWASSTYIIKYNLVVDCNATLWFDLFARFISQWEKKSETKNWIWPELDLTVRAHNPISPLLFIILFRYIPFLAWYPQQKIHIPTSELMMHTSSIRQKGYDMIEFVNWKLIKLLAFVGGSLWKC